MGRNLENTSALMNVASSGNPGEVGMRIVGLQGIMKKSESELNLEAFLCMSSEGEGECPDGDLGIKGANASDKTSGDFFPEKSPSDDALGGGALVDDPGSKDNFSSCGQKLGWCPSTALRGSSPASTGGSRLTYGCNNSGEQSDDEDDVETEAGQCEENLNGNDLKRMRRMVSNRESARRSRRRKQAHLNELESQVDQLRGENSSIFKQLTEVSQRCKDAASNNLILKSDVEALRSTVKMAQDLIATGPLANIVNQHLLQQPSITPPPTSWNMCWPFDIPQVLDSGCYLDASSLTETLTIEAERSGSDIKLKTDGNLPMQRTANMEQLQNRICCASDTWPWDTSPITKTLLVLEQDAASCTTNWRLLAATFNRFPWNLGLFELSV